MLSNRSRFSVAHWILLGVALAVGCGDDGGSTDPVDNDTDEDAGGSTDDTDDVDTDDVDTDDVDTDDTNTDDTDDVDTDETSTDDTDDVDGGASDAPSACYLPDEHVCDCDLDESECEAADGMWTDECTSCTGEETDAGATDDATDDAVEDAGADDTDDDVTDEPATDDAGMETDAGDPEPVFETIADLGGNVLPQVNDLRGLTFAASGKIYASGHVGASSDAERSIAVMRFNDDGTPDGTPGAPAA
jgi:hypothetical protein